MDVESITLVERTAADTVELLASGIDPDAAASGDWSVRDVAAHLTGLMPIYTGFLRGEIEVATVGESAAERIARANGACVDARATVGMGDVVAELEERAREFVEELALHDPAETVSGWQGRPIAAAGLAGIALAEFLVHGDDVARAVRVRWPIPAEAARVACLEGAWTVPWMLDPARTEGVDASWVVRLRDGGARWFHLHGRRADVEEWHGQPVDCTILAAPAAMLLVSYGRRSQWREIAKGNLLAWGRRPWIAVRIAHWFPNP